MQKFQGTSGDGLGALGLKPRKDGTYDLACVDTVIRGEAPFLRKAGMGGARYMRHCLESSVLERGGLWMPDTIEMALDILEKLDGGLVRDARFESWVYVTKGDSVERQDIQPHVPMSGAALQHRKFVEKDINWSGLFQQSVDQASEELERASLRPLWTERYHDTCEAYLKGTATQGQMLCALLTRQAQAERMFLISTATDEDFATEPFLTLLGARYVRTLCQLDLAGDELRVTNPLFPDLTEVGRTILLLCAAGRVPEAIELGTRVASALDKETLFVPMVPRLALAFAANRDDLFATEEHDFGTTLQKDCQAVLAHVRGAEDSSITDELTRIVAARSRQMGGYSDEYHIDFDDGLSWGFPYEALAIIGLCQHFKRPVPAFDHPAQDWPTARIPDLRNASLPYQDVYAAFLAQRTEA